MSAFRARALIAASALFAGCVHGVTAAETVGALPDGGVRITQSMNGAPAAAIELWYRAPATGFGTVPLISLARLAAETVLASKPLVGKPLGTVVSEAGGRVAVNVYGDSVAIAVSAPAAAASEIVRAVTTAFFAPVVTEDGYHEAQQTVAQEALIAGFNPDDFTRDADNCALFSAGPAHYPISGSPAAIQHISLEAVRSYASRAFRSQNAVLVAVGAPAESVTRAAVAGRTALSAENAGAEPMMPSPLAHMPRLIAKSFDEAGGAYGWAGPPISDERAATAMDFIADYLFRPDLGLVSRRLAQTQPEASVSGQFITLHDPGVFFVTFTGPKPNDVKAAVDEGLTAMRTPLPAAAFAHALEAFQYHLLSDLQTPLSVADNFGWYAVEGNLPYAPGANNDDGAYFRAARALTPAFVASVARAYLEKPGVTVLLSPKTLSVKKGSAS